MARTIIDLSVFLENEVVSDPPGYQPRIDYIDHRTSVPDLLGFFPGLSEEDLPDGEAWAIERIALNQSLQRSISEGNVTARANRHMQIAHLRSEECRFNRRWHPVVLEAGFEEWVDHHHTSSRHTGFVEIFHEYRLIVRRVCTPDNQEIGRDHIGERTRCCRNTDGGLECGSRWRVTDARCRVDIRDAHCTRRFTGHVIGLVGDAAAREEDAHSIGVGLA
jgi:hypothetical protein